MLVETGSEEHRLSFPRTQCVVLIGEEVPNPISSPYAAPFLPPFPITGASIHPPAAEVQSKPENFPEQFTELLAAGDGLASTIRIPDAIPVYVISPFGRQRHPAFTRCHGRQTPQHERERYLISAFNIPRLPPVLRAAIAIPFLLVAVPFLLVPLVAVICLSVMAHVHALWIVAIAAFSATVHFVRTALSFVARPLLSRCYQTPRSDPSPAHLSSTIYPKFVIFDNSPPLSHVVVRMLWALATLSRPTPAMVERYFLGSLMAAKQIERSNIDLEGNDPDIAADAHCHFR
ncbi:hypothetical protein BJ742DRAFT_850990 [Cladochytrium replicatum]|nr:hypothetical protein BJ742DRAFT_850990 [Cladochytrium replicatum]